MCEGVGVGVGVGMSAGVLVPGHNTSTSIVTNTGPSTSSRSCAIAST